MKIIDASQEENCLTCIYEPDWGGDVYKEGVGACKWPCPPCLAKLLRPIKRDKLFTCAAWRSKEDVSK